MAFILEDGTGVVGANAYIDVAFLGTYHLNRGVPTASQYNSTDKEAAIVRATDYAELVYGPYYLGRKLTSTQGLRFPRHCIRDPESCGGYFPPLPVQLQNAIAEYALRELVTPFSLLPDPVVSDTGMQILSSKEKVGPIEESITYTGSAPASVKPFPKGDRWMVDLIGPQGGSYRA